MFRGFGGLGFRAFRVFKVWGVGFRVPELPKHPRTLDPKP